MPERILITGITGFVGSHLADYVLARGASCELYGTKRWHLSRMDHVAHVVDRIQWRECNLLDPGAVRDLVADVRPDRIFHCAAESFVSPSWKHPSLYMDVNYKCTLHLLEAMRCCDSKASIHIPGSGEEYGEILPAELPIREDSVLRPVNPYAVSKIAQDLIGYVYFKSYGVRVIRTRTFNHEGPRRQAVFGIPWYAYQIARVEQGKQEPRLEVYLIGSEQEDHVHTFRDALERLIEMSTVRGISYETVPKYVRPTQVPNLIADMEKFRARTGWQSKIPFEQILVDTLEYWRARVAAGQA
jgi:GDP-4-dehydro-6-deoxy-D-mannose reductase